MKIEQIKNGIVIDHITAGLGMKVFSLLGLDELDCAVAIIKNASSHKMGKKDIIKIDADIDLNLDILGYVDPGITVNVIRDSELVEKEEKRLLRAAVSRLAPRERLIIELRFGFNGKQELTQKEVADLLGISQSYISRLEKKIIAELREELAQKN